MSLAIMTLKNASGITEGEASLITDRLGVELFNTGMVNVMERNQMQEILKEQGFQQSGACTDEECLVEVGQMLGVEGLVSGSIGKLGSMYLINLRVINVSTARITHVVSEDVTGGIEQVAIRLKSIAKQLVGKAVKAERREEPKPQPTTQPAPPPPPEPEPEPAPEPEPTPEPRVVDNQPTPEPTPPPEPSVEMDERKKNRSGIRFSFAYMLGGQRIDGYSYYSGSWQSFDEFLDTYLAEREGYGEDVSQSSVNFRGQLVFMIKAGRLVAIDIGPGILRSTYRFDNTYNGSYERDESGDLRITAPFVHMGVNIVPRIYPLKLNLGLFVQANLNFVAHDYSFYSYSSSGVLSSDYEDDFDFGFNLAFGPRVGAEILLSPKFGISLDFTYTYYRLTADLMAYGYEELRLKVPGAGLQAGMNIYY